MNPTAAACLHVMCLLLCYAVGADEVTLGDLTMRIQSLTPTHIMAADIVPGLVRLVGYDEETTPSRSVKRAMPFTVFVYFQFLPECERSFSQELIVTLNEADIARIPMRFDDIQPGSVVKQELKLYLPRNAPLGNQLLKIGFVRKGSPGESRQYLSPYMAPLMHIEVLEADPVYSVSELDKQNLFAVSAPTGSNVLANGGFESKLRNWVIGEGIQEGLAGWNRVLSLALDTHVYLSGECSLRIDFCGGQDVNFFHVTQDFPAKGDCEYHVRYFIKTQDITSNEGPAIAVRDPDIPISQFYAVTPKNMRLTGTHDWTSVAFSFRTPPRTKRLRMIIRRDGSGLDAYYPERFGVIGGSAWYDQIQIFEQPQKAL